MLAADPLGITPYLDVIQEGKAQGVKHWLFRVNTSHREELQGCIKRMFPTTSIVAEKKPDMLFVADA